MNHAANLAVRGYFIRQETECLRGESLRPAGCAVKRVRVLFGLLAVSAALSACAPSRSPPPPFIGNEVPKIDPDKGRCIEVEREPGPEGGLRIPRQTVCPAFTPQTG